MLKGNANVQSVCVSMPIAIPSDAGPAESFLDLMLRVFSACSRSCNSLHAAGEAAPGDAVTPPSPDAPAAVIVAALKLLTYWLANCPAALVPFASSPVMVPLAMDLTKMGSQHGPFFQIQVEGLAALLMGACIRAEQGDVDVASLMALLARRVGIEEFQQKVERLWRSEPLQRPPRGLAAFRWHNGAFRAFVREQQRAVQRRMVQLYVSEGVGGGGASLAEDVADEYKQLIRVQDSELREVRRENEQLRVEVEAFMRKSLQASSFAIVDKTNAMQLENEALHEEVAQLTQEVEERSSRLEHERQQLRGTVSELEQQLQSMAIGYEQVERTSEALTRDNAQLRASLEAAERARRQGADAPQRLLALEQEAASARQRAEELQRERTDLLELLGHIVATCPDAARFVAPLGVPVSLPVAAGVAKAAGPAPLAAGVA